MGIIAVAHCDVCSRMKDVAEFKVRVDRDDGDTLVNRSIFWCAKCRDRAINFIVRGLAAPGDGTPPLIDTEPTT